MIECCVYCFGCVSRGLVVLEGGCAGVLMSCFYELLMVFGRLLTSIFELFLSGS